MLTLSPLQILFLLALVLFFLTAKVQIYLIKIIIDRARESKHLKDASGSSYMVILTFLAAVNFFWTGHHTAFEMTTAQDIPLVLSLSSEFLPNDFYTQSVTPVLENPRFAFAYFVHFLTLLDMNWHSVLYLLKILVNVGVPPLLFAVACCIAERWAPSQSARETDQGHRFVLFLMALGLSFFPFLERIWLLGWPPIQTIEFLSPMALSFVLGLGYTYCRFNLRTWHIFRVVILFCSTLMHPAVGLFTFALTFVFYIPSRPFLRGFSDLSFDFLVGVIGPISLGLFMYSPGSSVDAKTFIDSYVYLRHPNHYLVSNQKLFHIFVYTSLLTIPMFISRKLNDRRVFTLSALVFSLFILAPVVQFLGVEVWKVKKVAMLGPSRLSLFFSIAIGIEYIVIAFHLASQCDYLPRGLSVMRRVLVVVERFVEAVFYLLGMFFKFVGRMNGRALYLGAYISLSLIIFGITKEDPMEFHESGGNREVIKWIAENTSSDSVFFIRDNPFGSFAFLVRVYGNRAIFADYAFPFHEDAIEGFTERLRILKESEEFSPENYMALQKKYSVDYVIVHGSERPKFEPFEPALVCYDWLVYEIGKFE
ncbi:hypothetical protein N8494_01580 [bacterium]|nr:hypothetical protein [bacterium]